MRRRRAPPLDALQKGDGDHAPSAAEHAVCRAHRAAARNACEKPFFCTVNGHPVPPVFLQFVRMAVIFFSFTRFHNDFHAELLASESILY